MLPPSNSTDALRLITNMRGYYKTAQTAFKEDDNYYEGLLEDSIELPEGFDITIPTTARAIIDEAVDNIEPYDMMIRYAPRGFGKDAQLEADNVGRFLKNMWLYWRRSNSDIDILRDFIKNLFKNGKAAFKVVPDWSLWPSLDETTEGELYAEGGKKAIKVRADLIKNLREQNFPVIARSVSPRHFIEDPTMDARKLWILEFYDVSVEEVRNKYSKYDEMFAGPEPVSYTVSELWTATYVDWNGKVNKGKHFIFINSECMNGEEGEDNPYHDIPWVVKHSGFGTENYDGKPEFKSVGFFTRQVKSMLRAEIRRVTHFDALMQQMAFPILMFPDTMEDNEFDTTPGAINYVPEELLAVADKIYLQAKLPAPEYMQSINMIQAQIERGTTQRALRGAGVPGTDSAAQLSMITSQAKLRLEPIKRATEEAVDMVNALVLRIINEVLGDKVSIFGAEPLGPDNYVILPKQIKGRYRTRTTFMPNEEQVKERKLILATDAMAKAQLNPYDALSIAGFENPMEIIGRNFAYEMMKEPAIKRQLAKQYLKEWGLDTQELELEELNDQSVLKQMMEELKAKIQPAPGTQPGGQPGQDLMGQNAQTQQPAEMPAGPPQAVGSPVQMPDQQPQMPDPRQMMNANG